MILLTARRSDARAGPRADMRADMEVDMGADSINRVPTVGWGMGSVVARCRGIVPCLSKMRAWDNMAARHARNSSRVPHTGLLHHQRRRAPSTARRQRARRGILAAQRNLCQVREARE